MSQQPTLEELDELLADPRLSLVTETAHCKSCGHAITATSAVGIAAARIQAHLQEHADEESRAEPHHPGSG